MTIAASAVCAACLLSTPTPARGDVPSTQPTRNLFGAFNMNMTGLPPAKQVDLLHRFGYQGLMFWWNPGAGLKQIKDFQEATPVKDGSVKLLAVLALHNFTKPMDTALLDSMFEKMAVTHTYYWLMLDGPRKQDEQFVAALQTICDHAQARGVEVVFYPHFGQYCDNVEDSLRLIKLANRPNLFTSVHLCHELKKQNQSRLDEVIQHAAPMLKLASVNGAFNDGAGNKIPGWSRVICPLDEGDFDAKLFLRPLRKFGYTGPILLHTAGVAAKPEDHYPRSMSAWKSLNEALDQEDPK